jgi:hypothetical protein
MVAGFAAVFAVHEPVVTNSDVCHGLAEAAEFFTIARTFGLVALCAAILGGTRSRTHQNNVARFGRRREMTLVIAATL